MFSIYATHAKRRGNLALVVSGPFIYSMIVPLALMDLCISFYQNICFPLYGIPRVPRKRYVQIVRRGKGLRLLDRFNCAYCSYANGVCAYMRAVLIETEKYWCPIKYQARAGYAPPHPQEAYAEDGDIAALESGLPRKRS